MINIAFIKNNNIILDIAVTKGRFPTKKVKKKSRIRETTNHLTNADNSAIPKQTLKQGGKNALTPHKS